MKQSTTRKMRTKKLLVTIINELFLQEILSSNYHRLKAQSKHKAPKPEMTSNSISNNEQIKINSDTDRLIVQSVYTTRSNLPGLKFLRMWVWNETLFLLPNNEIEQNSPKNCFRTFGEMGFLAFSFQSANIFKHP